MIRILRNILVSLLGLTSFFLSLEAYAQDEKCAGTPVKEAVRNGDFEAGYLPGPDQGVTTASHTFTPGDQFDFESDLQYAGKWHGAKGFCDWGMANQYGVGRVEKMTNPGCAGNQIVYGMYANAATYKDHTTGTDKGFSLIVDFDGKSGFKTVWAQNVDVYSSQKYYFSAWFALYAGSATPTLRFRVESYDAGGTLIEQKTLGSAPIAPPIMQWQQFNGVYDTPSNAKTAKIFIECEPAGGTGNDDFIIDDISFINGCQKIKTFVSYEAEFDEEEVSLCYNNNAYTAQVKKDNGTNLGPTGKTITWFKGDGASQTEVAAFANQDAPNITEPGTYRACIVDIANNGCTVNASLVVTEDLEVTLPAADLCDPAEVTLNTNRTEAGLVHNWTVPAGATKSTTNEQLANVGGDYTANVSLPSNPNCKASGTSKVTSSLPVPPTNLTYCDGGGEKSTLAYQNTKWKWCEDKDCNTVIGEGTSVDWTPAAGTTGDQTLYMQNATTSNISGGSIGNNTGTTDIAAGSYTNITVLQTVLLASVKATIPSWLTGAQNRNVEIKNLTTGDSKTYGPFNIKSNSVANVNAVLPAGKYRIFIRGGGAQTAPDWTGNGPALYSVKDYVNITGYSGNGKTHGPFKQLTFKKTEACAPVAVTIKAEQCCLTPKSVTVTATKEELCTGDQSNLSVDVQYESGTTATNFIAFWVKDGTTDPLNATKISNLTGLTSADAGDYTHVVIDKDKATNIGCAKVSTVTLTALPAPTTADAGDDVTDLCTEEYDLQGNSLATGETGKWTVKSGSGNFADDTNPTTKVTGLGFGDNVFVWTITNSCGETKDEVKITRLEPIAGGSLTQPTGNVCADSTGLVFEVTGITGTNPVYDWTMPTGVTQNGSGASIKLNVGSNVASGTSGDVKVSISGDCPGTVDLSATLNWDNVPDVSNASITAIDPVCVNNTGQQTLELTGFVGTVDSYGWSATDPANPTNLIFLTGTSNPLNAQLTQQITFGATEASKTITIRVQAQNKCGDSDVVEGSAKIDNLPTESKIAFTDAKLCIKDPIFLSGNTPVIGTGKWVTAGSTTGGTVKDENDGGSELTNLQGGQKYEGKWVISNGVCPASEENVSVEGEGIVDAEISFNVQGKVCEGEEVTIEAFGKNGGDTPIYKFLDESGSELTGGTLSASGTDYTFIPSVGDTKVQVEFTSNSSCVQTTDPIKADFQTITVEAAPKGLSITKPVPSSGDVFETCETTVALEATATAGTVSWNITPISGTGTITDNGSGKADVTGIPEGTTIEVQAVSSSGTTCTAITETVKIEVKGKITPAKLEDDYAICISDAGTVNIVNLSGTLKTGETDSWAPGDGDSHLTINNGSVSGLKVGTNKIKYSVDNGLCPTSTDEIIITVDELPQAPTVTDVSTCDSKIGLNGVNPNTSLDGQNPGSAGVWSWEVVTPSNGGTITDPTDPLSEITSLATNGNNKTDITVKATITNGECSASDDMVISQLGTIPDISFSYQGTDYTDGKIENGSPQTIDQLCVGATMSVDVVGADADHVGTWTGETDGITATPSTNSVDLTFSKVGTYTLEYTLAKKSDAACNAKASLTLVSLDKPDAPTKSGTDPAPVCEGSDITFTANAVVGAESYQWENDFGLGNNGTSTSETYTFSSEATGAVNVFAKNICGLSSAPASFNVEVVSPAAITINSVISELCAEGNKAPQNLETLSSFSGKESSGVSNNYTNTYTWYDDATNAVINQVSYPVTGAATIRVEGTNDVCKTPVSKTTSFKTINPTIILEDEYQLTRASGDRKLICLSSKATTPFLKDVGPGTGTYEWEVYGVPQPPTTNQLFLEGALIDGLFEEQPITVTKTVPGCSQPFGPVTVNVYSIPETNPKLEFVSERKYVCADDESAGNKVSLQVVDLGISTSGHYITSYSWNTGQTGKIEEINKGGDYYVNVNHTPSASLGFNATDVDKAKVCNNPTPTFNVPSYDVSVSIDEIEPIDAQNGDESTDVNVIPQGSGNASPAYIWTIDSYTGSQVAFGANAEITIDNMPSTGIIYLTSKYEECTATAEAKILVFEEVTPPNVFSPNGDGQHDTWQVPGLETYPEASVTIYNRWGNVVYQTYGGYSGDREWNGKNQNTGGEVTVGAFYYVIELNVEGRKPISGHINVIR